MLAPKQETKKTSETFDSAADKTRVTDIEANSSVSDESDIRDRLDIEHLSTLNEMVGTSNANTTDTDLIRIGAVSYLNTKPLIESLAAPLDSYATLSVALPSELADQMSNGKLDVALVPCIEFFRHQDWEIISDACIGCDGPVWSVKLLFRTRPASVQTMSLDIGSRTSAVLARILLIEKFSVRPETRLLALDEDPLACDSDCVLVIGDRAMHDEIGGPFIEEWDLGEIWKQHTGLPFVFAMWVARNVELEKKRRLKEVANGLSKSRDDGLAAIDEISSKYASQYGLSVDTCQRYLGRYLNYHLNQVSRTAMDLYHAKAVEYQLI